MSKIAAIVTALSLLLGGVALLPADVQAVGWIGQADGWVKDIEQELNKKEYRQVFLNDPRTPQVAIVRLLERAEKAYAQGNQELARDFARQAVAVLEDGLQRHYYSEHDIAPLIAYIERHVPVKAAG